jgi:translation elongation factor EF-Tu-like GTPase
MGAATRRARLLSPVGGGVGALLCAAFVSCAQAGPVVTLIGDGYRFLVMDEVAADERSGVQSQNGFDEVKAAGAGVTLRNLHADAGATQMADLLQITDIALMVVDTTVGPTPEVREHILIARQARVPMLAIMLSNVARLQAGAPEEGDELLAVEVKELRALLSIYDFDGAGTRVYYDARTPATAAGDATAFGSREVLRALSRYLPRRVRPADMGQVNEIWGAVYLLTKLEAAGEAVTLTPQDTITVWSEGTQTKATLRSMTQYYPGDFREMLLSLASPLTGTQGSRLLLVSGENVVGLGTITEILR